MENYEFTPVARVKSCFKSKFGIPRQPGLVPEASGEIVFVPPFNQPNAVRGLEEFSHIWVLFVFHQSIREHWKATVRPPRLGGDRRIGVFSSRSPFRPNPIGLSVLKLKEVICRNGRVSLLVDGLDMVDGTPVIDVKPYVPYADSVPGAIGSFAHTAPDAEALQVVFSDEAAEQCRVLEAGGLTGFKVLAEKLIAANPRPAYQKIPGRVYGIFIHGYEVVWQASDEGALVTGVTKADKDSPGLK